MRHACHNRPSSVLPPVQLNNSMCSFLKPASRELARVVMATVNFNTAGVAGSIVMVSHLGTFAHDMTYIQCRMEKVLDPMSESTMCIGHGVYLCMYVPFSCHSLVIVSFYCSVK